jgi:hypothetical protein
MVGSSHAGLFASSRSFSTFLARWSRTKLLEMLEEIHRTGGDDKYLPKPKTK